MATVWRSLPVAILMPLVAFSTLAQAPPSRALPVGNPTLPEQVHFYHADALGSTRAITDDQGEVVARHDYLPFGEQIPADVSGRDLIPGYSELADSPLNIRRKFTGKERDIESGLDYFGARYYSGPQGRFTGADPDLSIAGTIMSPGTWNRYVYVKNNPLRYVDPDGENFTDALNGFLNAVGSNHLAGAGRMEPHNRDARIGQFVGDVASMVAGAAEGAVGTAIVQGGGEVAGLSLAAEGPSLGSSTVGVAGGAGVAVVGVGVTVEGAVTGSVAAKNVAAGLVAFAKNVLGGGDLGAPDGPKPGSTGGPGTGRRATQNERAQTLQENDGKCVFCGETAKEAEHSIPTCRGGDCTTGPGGNLQPSCIGCNRGPGGKHTQTSEEFLNRKAHEAGANVP